MWGLEEWTLLSCYHHEEKMASASPVPWRVALAPKPETPRSEVQQAHGRRLHLGGAQIPEGAVEVVGPPYVLPQMRNGGPAREAASRGRGCTHYTAPVGT